MQCEKLKSAGRFNRGWRSNRASVGTCRPNVSPCKGFLRHSAQRTWTMHRRLLLDDWDYRRLRAFTWRWMTSLRHVPCPSLVPAIEPLEPTQPSPFASTIHIGPLTGVSPRLAYSTGQLVPVHIHQTRQQHSTSHRHERQRSQRQRPGGATYEELRGRSRRQEHRDVSDDLDSHGRESDGGVRDADGG